MLVKIVEEFFESHPSRQGNYKRHATKFHRIRCFVEYSLVHSQMVLLTIVVAFIRKSGNVVFKDIVVYLPTLVLVKFVSHLHNTARGIRKILDLHYLPEYPPSISVPAVDKHIFLYLLVVDGWLVIEVGEDEVTKISFEFISIQFIWLPHF